MAIAFRAAGTAADSTTATTSSLTVGKPAGLTTGDFVIIHLILYDYSTTDIAPPSNTWYQVPVQDEITTNFNPDYHFIYYHVATNSEPTWNFLFSTAVKCSARAVAYSGVGSLTAVGINDSAGVSGTTVTAPSVTTVSGDVLLQFIGVDKFPNTPVLTLAGGLTSRYNAALTATNAVMALGEDAAPSNPSSAYSNSSTQAVYWAVPVVVLHPTGTLPVTISDFGLSSSRTNQRVAPGGTVTTASFTTPADSQDGNLLVAFLRVGSGSGNAWTVPAGWTQVRADGNTSGSTSEFCGLFTKVASSDQSVSYSWTVTGPGAGGSSIFGFIGCVRGVSSTIDTTTINSSSGDATTLNSTAITTAVDNEFLMYFASWANDAGGSSTWNSNRQRDGGNQGVGIFTGLAGKAGSQAALTFNNGVTASVIVYTLALTPLQTPVQTYIDNWSINTYTGTSQAFTVPSTAITGDVAIAHVCVGTGITITPPAAWNLISSSTVDDGTNKSSCYSHTVAGGDPSSVTFSFSGSTTGCGSVMVFRNASEQFVATTTTTASTAPALTGIPAGRAILDIVMAANIGGQTTQPNGIDLQNLQCLPCLLQYTNGTTHLTGAITLTPATACAGGAFGVHKRPVANAGAHGITIAFNTTAPVPPTPPPPIPPPPVGPGPNLPFVFTGRIARLPSIPPVHNFHEVNLILKQKMLEISDLQKQIIQYASNPQQHYKVTQATPTVQQTDTAQQFATQGAFAPVQSSDTWTAYPSTGYTTTTGGLVSGGGLVIPTATPTALNTASPNYPISTNDVIYIQVNGTFAAGMALTLLEFTVVGTPSTQVYAGFTATCDNGQNFAVTQQFTVQPAVAVSADTGVIVKLTQRTGGNVTLNAYNVSVGNIQAR